MQHGPVFGGVDLLAGEHGFDPFGQVGLAGQVEQQGHGFVGDAVLGEIEQDIAQAQREALEALRVVRQTDRACAERRSRCWCWRSAPARQGFPSRLGHHEVLLAISFFNDRPPLGTSRAVVIRLAWWSGRCGSCGR